MQYEHSVRMQCMLKAKYNLSSSVHAEGSKQTVVGLALAVAFIISGHGFAKFNKTLNQYLGISALSKQQYYEVIQLMYPHITGILNQMCEDKARMKELPEGELGHWKKAQRMRALGEFHSKDIHKWEEGECGFHDLIVCSCGHCEEDGELQCEGKQYSTKHKLTCSDHHLAYRTECERRAEDASAVIHPEMERGHSNLCEANFTVLPEFRAKDQSLCRLVTVTYYDTIQCSP